MTKKILDFVIVGAQKCGTTSLAEQLNQLNGLCLCDDKEPHFFSKNKDWQSNLDDYYALFKENNGSKLFEASTTYTFCDEYPHAIKALYTHNPSIKLIYLVRDPVARIESHFNHRLRNGVVSRDFVNAIGTHPCFIERSEYFRQIEHILNTVPKAQLKVVIFEDYIKQPLNVLKEILDFIDEPNDLVHQIDLKPRNVSDASLKFKSPMIKKLIRALASLPMAYRFARWLPVKIGFPREYKRVLWRMLAPDVAKLEQLLGMSLSRWREKYQYKESDRL